MCARGQFMLALDSLVDVPGVDSPVEAREQRPLLLVLPLQQNSEPAKIRYSRQNTSFCSPCLGLCNCSSLSLETHEQKRTPHKTLLKDTQLNFWLMSVHNAEGKVFACRPLFGTVAVWQ